MALNLDIHNLFHDQIAHDLERDGDAHHDVAYVVGK